MENTPKNLNKNFNEALRTKFNLDEKVEQFYTKPETDDELEKRVGIIKSIPENLNNPKVLLKLGDPSHPDKFVHMKDEEGRDYVIALPIDKQAFHRDIANFCRKLYKKELTVLGGGYTHAEGDKLVIHGTSEGFGEANKTRVGEILKEAFPDLKIEITSYSQEQRNQKEMEKNRDYNNALEKISGNVERDLYADIVQNKAVRMGYDLTMLPKRIEGSEGNIAYMVYRSENGSSFGIDALYLGYKDKDGTIKSKELAQTRWNLEVTKSVLKDGILTIEIKTEDNKKYTISSHVSSLENVEIVSNLDENEKILLQMYKDSQFAYTSQNSKVWHDFVH